MCIQELHTTSCHECFTWFSPFGFECITSPGSARSCGTALLYRPKFNAVKSSFNSDGRLASGVFSFDNVIFSISSVYAPNRNPDRNCFLQLVHDSVDPAIPSFLCGDLNTVFDRSLDRRGSNATNTSRESSTVLRSLFADCCVIDISILEPLALLGSVLMVRFPHVLTLLLARLVGVTLSRPVTSFLVPILITRPFSFKFLLLPLSLADLVDGSLMFPS